MSEAQEGENSSAGTVNFRGAAPQKEADSSSISGVEGGLNLSKDFDLKNYLEVQVNKLHLIRQGDNNFSKEMTYTELLRFVRNCEKLKLDYQFLIENKVLKYLHIAYVLLIAINDTSSLGYQQLLPRLSGLFKNLKELILHQVPPPTSDLLAHR